MGQLKRFIDWCKRPSMIKVHWYRPSNILVILSFSIVISSVIATVAWYQAATTLAILTAPRVWGGKSFEGPKRMTVDRSSIYVTGRTLSFGVGESNAFLLKYDLKGNLKWNVTWESPNFDSAYDLVAYGDDIYITGFTTVSTRPKEEDMDVFLAKFDKDGQLLWNTTWGGIGWMGEPSRDYSRDIEVLDGFIYIVGTTTHDASSLSEQDILLLKYDSEGQLIWEKNLGMPSTYEYGNCLEVEGDALYVAGMFMDLRSPSTRIEDQFLAKLDSDGRLLWNITWGGAGSDSCKGMVLHEGDIYITGSKYISNTQNYDIFLQKFDQNGQLQWSKTWGGEDLDSTSGGIAIHGKSVYVVGATRSFDAEGLDVILLEYDFNGVLRQNSTWGGEGNDIARSVSVIKGILYIMGQTGSYGEGSSDVFLLTAKGSLENPIDLSRTPFWMEWWYLTATAAGIIAVSITVWVYSTRTSSREAS